MTLHAITYSRRRGHRTKHRWDCSCGDGGQERTGIKAQLRVAFHLWWTNRDHDPFGGDDARMAIMRHKLSGKPYRDIRGRFARHPKVTLHEHQMQELLHEMRGEG